jgi:hypothetical protein
MYSKAWSACVAVGPDHGRVDGRTDDVNGGVDITSIDVNDVVNGTADYKYLKLARITIMLQEWGERVKQQQQQQQPIIKTMIMMKAMMMTMIVP